MHKLKIIAGLATLVCALAAMTTPALAIFESTNGTPKGPVQKFPTVSTLTLSNNAVVKAMVTCVNSATTKATGFWTIQNSEETVVENTKTKEQSQPETKVGPHEAITIQKWGGCFAKIGGAGAVEAKVTECRLQIAQPGKGGLAGLGSVQTNCTVTASGCPIVIPQTKANHNLTKVTLANGEGNVEIFAKATGFLYNAKGAICEAAGLSKEGKEAEFKTGESGTEPIINAQQTLI